MNAQLMRVLALMLAVGALVLGYVGYRLSTAPVEPTRPDAPAEPSQMPDADLQPVIIAGRRLAAGRPIAAEDLKQIRVPVVREGAYTRSSDLVERAPAVPVMAGEILLESHFRPGGPVAQLLAAGERAVAVKVDEVVGGGGYARPGDYVDVLVYLRGGLPGIERSQARTLIERAKVLAYGKDLAVSRDGRVVSAGDEARADSGSRSAVLAVPRGQAEKLMLAENAGTIRLAVVASSESAGGDRPGPVRAGVLLEELDMGARSASREYRIPVYRGTERSFQAVTR